MKLTFGMACDGPCFPDFPGDKDGVFNASVVGPMGLLDALEIQLGLTGPRVAHAVRIACYASKLRAALAIDVDLFFAKSFALDPWATATTLLEWRDQLIAAGWPRAAVGADRPDALAKVEELGPSLPQGVSDRLCQVYTSLKSAVALSLAAIDLVEPRRLVPAPWRRLLDALETRGVAVVEPEPSVSLADGDLGVVQRHLVDGAVGELTGDGTFVQICADTALTAAEAVAEWLAHCPEEELHGTVIVSPDGDTALLDMALTARGLPALGQSAASPWRGALQVLPLAFAAAWAPLDAKAMLDLLLLPRPPILRRAARKLAYALSREPGTGGTAWADAWEAIEKAETEATEDGAGIDVAARLAAWREWTAGGIHPRSEGMPAADARAMASRVARWATETDAGNGDTLLLAVAGAANAMVQATDLIGLEILPALLIERMIDQVLAEGAKNPDHVATAGGLRCACSPGAIWREARNVVWWDFRGPGERVPNIPWSNVEMSALAAAGCVVISSSDAAELIGRNGANPALRANERLLLVTSALSGSDQVTSHPLAHQLEPLIGQARALVTWSAEQLLVEAEHGLAGRNLVREIVGVIEPPRPKAGWVLPEKARERLEGRTESATSFERLADCQMRWMLLDVLGLSRGRVAEIPGADQLLGNLAHDIANQVLKAGAVPDPDTVQARAEVAFDSTLDAIATPLRQPEHAGELASARVRVPAALAQLARMLGNLGVEVVGTEVERNGEFGNGLSVTGRLDLIVRHPKLGLGVVDLKWTKSARRRRTELVEGRALQLATYGAIADPESTAPVTGAYYLLSQRRLIAPEGSFLADEEVGGQRTLGQTWLDLIETWRTWRGLALDGSVVATGAAGAEDLFPADLTVAPSKEPCRYCELTGLCRVAVEAL